MSSFQDAGWIRRLWSLAKPGDPLAQYVSNVNIVNEGSYRGTRERAPFAMHSQLAFPAGAGVHNFMEIGGLDPLGPTQNLLHYARIEEGQAAALTGLIQWVIADGAALTTATRVATTPMFRDSDPDVTPQLFLGTIATANIPATAQIIPRSNSLGRTGATPVFDDSVTEVLPLRGLPFAATWTGPSRLIFFGEANTMTTFMMAWQAIRG